MAKDAALNPKNMEKGKTKRYFDTWEVAMELNVHESTLRYWERRFKILVMQTSAPSPKGRRRKYTHENIEQFRKIERLTQYFHLDGIIKIWNSGKVNEAMELVVPVPARKPQTQRL